MPPFLFPQNGMHYTGRPAFARNSHSLSNAEVVVGNYETALDLARKTMDFVERSRMFAQKILKLKAHIEKPKHNLFVRKRKSARRIKACFSEGANVLLCARFRDVILGRNFPRTWHKSPNRFCSQREGRFLQNDTKRCVAT